jgi:hypothetical protein
MTLIATRIYDLDGYSCTETVSRNDSGFTWTFDPGGHPQERYETAAMTLAEVFSYMKEAPHQIERAVY